MSMRPRARTSLYQTTARAWLTLAALSLLLPPDDRLGLWLPLHLALAGAIATAISGAMQNFMLSLTASPAPPAWTTWTQYGLVAGGAALIALGMVRSWTGIVTIGGAVWIGGVAILGWMLWRSWRRSVQKRHPIPMLAYGTAIVAALVGGALGALMGSGAVSGAMYLRSLHAHMTLNVLGFASMTVVGTLVTLLPTALRIRIPPWRGGLALSAFAVGLGLQLLGWDLATAPLLAVGGIAYAAGALLVVWFVAAALRTPREWKIPLAATHMMASVAWFVWGSLSLAWALIHGPGGFDRFRTTFLVAFVGGWLIQVLLGAWAYLLPMARPGHPAERRRMLAAFELAGPLQLALLNAGLVLTALRGADLASAWAGTLGVTLALVGGGIGLLKAWTFPLLSQGPVDTDRARAIWGQ